MTCDLMVLTILLHLSGGVENPLLFLYIIHVIIASLLFPSFARKLLKDATPDDTAEHAHV